jgi:hypothetical protein
MSKWKRGDFAGLHPRKPVEQTRAYKASERAFLASIAPPSLSAVNSIVLDATSASEISKYSPEAADVAKRRFAEALARANAEWQAGSAAQSETRIGFEKMRNVSKPSCPPQDSREIPPRQ